MSRKFLMIGTAASVMSAYARPSPAQYGSGDEEAESRQQTIVITGRKKA